MSGQTPHPETQTARRVKYGLNVAVAAVVAMVLVVLINWIAYRNNIRRDFTVTREYTLSPQTRQVLRQLDQDAELVTVFPLGQPQLDRVEYLVQEYGRASSWVHVDHVDPREEPTAFYQRIRDRFAEANRPLREAIEAAQEALTAAQLELRAMLEPLTEAASQTGDERGAGISNSLLEAWGVLKQRDDQITAELDSVAESLAAPLPNFAGAKSVLLNRMRDDLESATLPQLAAYFEQLKTHPAATNAVKNTLIELGEKIQPLRDRLRQAHEALAQATGSSQYDRLRSTLTSTPAVVVFLGQHVQVIPVTQMFPDQALLAQAQTDRDARFLGEERITGALVSLTMEQPPMVVFVVNRVFNALGERGRYNHVAQRLTHLGFDVRQWNPQGQFTPDGRSVPPTPPPQPAEGQKAVWVFLPRAPADPMDFMSAGAGEQVASLVQDKLEVGDGVMVLFMADPATRFGGSDPVNEALDTWGLTVQLDRVVLQEIRQPDQAPRANNALRVESWPQDLSVSKALKGMRGLFVQACPIIAGPAEGVTQYEIAVIEDSRLWAERDLGGLREGDADYDEADAADRFLVGVAGEKDGRRLVVVSDPLWASDDYTTLGRLDQYVAPGLADISGALFPANAELFVNSVLWLSDLEELIAASPRSQDIRRIAPMDEARLNGYRWTLGAGLPLGVLAIGMAVWFVRRRE